MGYTHYWYRPETLDPATFRAFTSDVRKCCDVAATMGLKIAGGFGDGLPVITDTAIAFNGASQCGHAKDESVVIPWPTLTAVGVGTQGEAKAGSWFAGSLLATRTCNGDCSYETFAIDQHETKPDYAKADPLVFACCKTAFRPYDVLVTGVLIALKHHFGETVRVSSDGDDPQWEDGRILTSVACGYGQRFHVGDDGLILV